MKAILIDVGKFINQQFDKILLIVILFSTLYRATESAALAKEIAIGAFSALLGFMQGKKANPDPPSSVK